MQPFYEVADECVLGVVAPPRPSAVQLSDPFRRVPAFFPLHFRLLIGDSARRLAESLEQIAPLVQQLRAGCGCTGDEVVRTNIQCGGFVRQWVCQPRMVFADCDWLKGPECLCVLVLEQLQPTLLLVLRPAGVVSNFEPEAFAMSKPVLVFQILPDEDFEAGVVAPLD
jgi:hypothetical protein